MNAFLATKILLQNLMPKTASPCHIVLPFALGNAKNVWCQTIRPANRGRCTQNSSVHPHSTCNRICRSGVSIPSVAHADTQPHWCRPRSSTNQMHWPMGMANAKVCAFQKKLWIRTHDCAFNREMNSQKFEYFEDEHCRQTDEEIKKQCTNWWHLCGNGNGSGKLACKKNACNNQWIECTSVDDGGHSWRHILPSFCGIPIQLGGCTSCHADWIVH